MIEDIRKKKKEKLIANIDKQPSINIKKHKDKSEAKQINM